MTITFYICQKIVGATEEVEDEEIIDDGATNVISLGHHFLQTPSGNVIKVEHDNELDFEDNIIYRYIFDSHSKTSARNEQ